VSLRHYYPERWDGKGDKFSVKQHAEDLATLIKALGVGPVYLVGHSCGGCGCEDSSGTTGARKKLVLMEGAFGPLLQKPASDDDGWVSLPSQKRPKARFDQGDIEGGLELWWNRDTPGRGRVYPNSSDE